MTEEELKKINEDIEQLKKINRMDNNIDQYTKAQLILGGIYYLKLKNYDKAEKFFLNVSEDDDPYRYVIAQLGLGEIYHLERGKHEQAEKFYLNVSKNYNAYGYSVAQYRLGEIYHLERGKHEEAKEFYLNVSKNDNAYGYAVAQHNLGDIYFKKNEYKIARKHYRNVCFDHKECYCKAQLYLSLIDNQDYSYSNKSDWILTKLKAIDECVENIEKALFVEMNLDNENSVSHYTKPEVLFYFLKTKDKSKMRLNLIDFMNDPTENNILTDWLGINNDEKNEDIKSFVTSFSFNHSSLNQFRLYGLEDGINGSGVSIVFKANFFCQHEKVNVNYEQITNKNKASSLLENKTEQIKEKNIFPLRLYRCVYFEPESQYIKIAKRNKQSFYRQYSEKDANEIDEIWNQYIKDIEESEKIESIRENLNLIKKTIKKSIEKIKKEKKEYLLDTFEQLVMLTVMPISCLIKHSAFEDEDECRIMYTTHISDEDIISPENYQDTNTLYLNYSEASPHIEKLYLGPKCKEQHKRWIMNRIENKDDKLNIKVKDSKLPLQ